MIGLLLFFHTLVCVLLIVVILMQSGRGGGLTEGFASAESVFGAKTNQFMVRATTLLTALFFLSSLSLAYMSAQRRESLMEQSMELDTTSLPAMEIPIDLSDEEAAGSTTESVQAGIPVPEQPASPDSTNASSGKSGGGPAPEAPASAAPEAE